MIRKAKLSDIPFIIEIGRRLHDRSGNEDVAIHKPTVHFCLERFIRSPEHLLLVSEREDVLRGFLMASVENYWWADQVRGRRYVTDWAFYSEHQGDGLRMLIALQEWAWSIPRVVEVACATNVPKGRNVVDKLYEKAGFERRGGMFKAVPQGEEQ